MKTVTKRTIKPRPAPTATVQFDYIKSNYFRTVRADGAIGAILPSGDIHMAVFSERPAIPRMTKHNFVNGKMSDPIATEGRAGYVRELECDVFLNVNSAKNLVEWLQKRIAEIEGLTKVRAPRTKSKGAKP